MQRVIDSAPHAKSHYSDAFNTYRGRCWWGEHRAMYDKSTTRNCFLLLELGP